MKQKIPGKYKGIDPVNNAGTDEKDALKIYPSQKNNSSFLSELPGPELLSSLRR